LDNIVFCVLTGENLTQGIKAGKITLLVKISTLKGNEGEE